MKQGILLVNTGTPASCKPDDIKAFLKRFLSDTRVIKNKSLLWKMVLHGIILRRRPSKAAKRYEKIWTEKGSPLLLHANAQKKHLQELLPDCVVEIGMSYSQPSIHKGLEKLLASGAKRLIIIPLFPQYSGTTVGSVFDSVSIFFC